ncbi:MAG TPA: TIGR03943 family protein, partial [Methylomirabilota bacterium]|nr:TIGR03943 family protein [Methylomirabilota bacterium]
MTVDRARLGRAMCLLAFALLIAKLLATGQMVKYMTPALNPLTAATGALLAAMAVAEILAVARRSGGGGRSAATSSQRAGDRDGRAPGASLVGDPRAGGGQDSRHARYEDGHATHGAGGIELALTSLLVLAPVVLGLVVTPRALGSGALGGEQVNRLLLTFATGDDAGRSAGALASAAEAPLDDLSALLAHLRRLGEGGVGRRVRVTGMAARSDALAPNELALLRYAIAHCVADARPLALLVVGAGALDLAEDQWVEVEGVVAVRQREGDRLVAVVAERITPIDEPV